MKHEAGTGKPLPTPTDVSRPYWDGLKLGEIRLQRCTSCADLQFYPRSMCRTCGARALEWEVVGNTGVVYSATVIHRPPMEAFASSVPYVYAIVELDAGPRLVTNIVADDVESVRIGMPVTAQFDDEGDVTLLRFRATN
jgi:uncharacterized protein